MWLLQWVNLATFLNDMNLIFDAQIAYPTQWFVGWCVIQPMIQSGYFSVEYFLIYQLVFSSSPPNVSRASQSALNALIVAFTVNEFQQFANRSRGVDLLLMKFLWSLWMQRATSKLSSRWFSRTSLESADSRIHSRWSKSDSLHDRSRPIVQLSNTIFITIHYSHSNFTINDEIMMFSQLKLTFHMSATMNCVQILNNWFTTQSMDQCTAYVLTTHTISYQ